MTIRVPIKQNTVLYSKCRTARELIPTLCGANEMTNCCGVRVVPCSPLKSGIGKTLAFVFHISLWGGDDYCVVYSDVIQCDCDRTFMFEVMCMKNHFLLTKAVQYKNNTVMQVNASVCRQIYSIWSACKLYYENT